jgi:hypothetical protein
MRHLITQKPIINSLYFLVTTIGIATPLSIKAQQPTAVVPLRIKTEQARAIKNVAISVFGDDTTAILTGATNTDGLLNLDLPVEQDFRIKAVKNDEQYVGVTTYDIAVIIRHIQDIEAIPTPYAMIAADVDESGEIDGADIVHIRDFILKRKPSLPIRTWRFVDKSYVFKKPSNPLLEDFPEYIDLAKVSKESKADFVAIKVGDVTAGFSTRPWFDSEADDAISERSNKTLPIQIEDIQLEAGKTYKIALTAKDFKAIAYQCALKCDANYATILGLEAADLKNMNEEHYAIMDNAVRISWDGTPTNNTSKLFYVNIFAEKNARLSDILTFDSQQLRAAAFNADGNPMTLRLDFIKNKVNDADVFTLFQNYPNPIVATTAIGFNLPTESSVRLTVFDNSGRIVKTIDQPFPKGYNEIKLDRADLKADGIVHYRLETPQYSATKTMLMVGQ